MQRRGVPLMTLLRKNGPVEKKESAFTEERKALTLLLKLACGVFRSSVTRSIPPCGASSASFVISTVSIVLFGARCSLDRHFYSNNYSNSSLNSLFFDKIVLEEYFFLEAPNGPSHPGQL